MGGAHDTSPKSSFLFQLHSMSNHEVQQDSYTSNHNVFMFLSKALLSPPPKPLAHAIRHSIHFKIFNYI